jgi:hypothetical protein
LKGIEMIKVYVFLTLLFIGSALNAEVYPIDVEHSGSDSVGESLAFQVREVIRKSEGYNLVHGVVPCFEINIITLDDDPDGRGNATTYSVVFLARLEGATVYPFYLTGLVGYAGRSQIRNVAEDIVAQLDGVIADLSKF